MFNEVSWGILIVFMIVKVILRVDKDIGVIYVRIYYIVVEYVDVKEKELVEN